jgi:hypothetical protein
MTSAPLLLPALLAAAVPLPLLVVLLLLVPSVLTLLSRCVPVTASKPSTAKNSGCAAAAELPGDAPAAAAEATRHAPGLLAVTSNGNAPGPDLIRIVAPTTLSQYCT